MNETRSPRWLPWALILAGVLAAARQLGWIDAGFLLDLISLWPLLLIAVGADLILRGRGRGLVIVAALAAAALLLSVPGSWAGGAVRTEAVSVPRDGATEASVDLEHAVGDLRLAAAAPDAAALITGTVTRPDGARLVREVERDGARTEVELRVDADGVRAWRGAERRGVDLRLAREVALDLDVEAGVGRADLDLRDVTLRRLDLDAGVGEVRVDLPATGPFVADVAAGVGEVVVRVPRDLPVALELERGLGRVDVEGDWRDVGATLRSAATGDAPEGTWARLHVEGGVGSVTVRQVE